MLALGFASLLAGIAGGLARLGFEPMPVSDEGVVLHGAPLAGVLLMLGGARLLLAMSAVILPAVLRVSLRYTPWFYLPVAALNLSLALRVAGDLAGHHGIRSAGSAGNALAIALFIAVAASAALRRRP